MKRSGMFNSTPRGDQSGYGSRVFFLTPNRYHLKRNRLDYQPLFGKGTWDSTPDSSKRRKSSLKVEMRALCFNCYFFVCP